MCVDVQWLCGEAKGEKQETASSSGRHLIGTNRARVVAAQVAHGCLGHMTATHQHEGTLEYFRNRVLSTNPVSTGEISTPLLSLRPVLGRTTCGANDIERRQ